MAVADGWKRSFSRGMGISTRHCEAEQSLLACISRLSDGEIRNELSGMRNLALWLYRNDEGIAASDEYQDFFVRLKLFKEEAFRRGIEVRECVQGPTLFICKTCGERFAARTKSPFEVTDRKLALGICSICRK